ncbi:MAG: hypothetical protein H7842_02395, partial [Gammaproteobacteria bacterium SHHR-1]
TGQPLARLLPDRDGEWSYDGELPPYFADPVDAVVMRRVECCECGWIGGEDKQRLIDSPSLKALGVQGWDHVCPKCGHDEFYQL